MNPGPRRLVLRIYLVTTAQVLAILLAVGVVGWLTFAPPERGGPRGGRVRFLLDAIAQQAPDRTAMEEEAKRVAGVLRAEVTVYGPKGELLFSTAAPPLRYPSGGCPTNFDPGPVPHEHGPDGRDLRPHPPPVIAMPLGALDACGVVRLGKPGPPPPLLWQTVVAVVVALVGAGIASVLLARALSRPLQTLIGTAQALGKGDLSARARLKRTDELGQVGEAFDEMADRLTQLLRSQQELLANVSHELRTPLARIRVALDLAAEGDATTAKEALREIDEDLGELQRLVADVLSMARLDLSAGRVGSAVPPLREEIFDARALLERSSQRFLAKQTGRQLVLEAPDPQPSLRGDPILLRRALDNLLDNAAQYSEAGTPVVLRAQGEGDQWVLVVIDRGIGIAPEHLAQVGTPFFRTDWSRARRTGGLGLGLSLAKRILEAHGGRLDLASTVGQGTTVTLRIPIAVPLEEHPGQKASEQAGPLQVAPDPGLDVADDR